MTTYNKILVALDLSSEAEQVLARAIELASIDNASLTLVHVIEPVVVENSYDLITTIPVELETSLMQRAEEFLSRLAEKMQIESCNKKVEAGSVKNEILRLAEQEQVDLIVIGTHGRHGLSILLGSTANAVLHGTPCDVYAVRIKTLE